jgi:hypothetical protein
MALSRPWRGERAFAPARDMRMAEATPDELLAWIQHVEHGDELTIARLAVYGVWRTDRQRCPRRLGARSPASATVAGRCPHAREHRPSYLSAVLCAWGRLDFRVRLQVSEVLELGQRLP